MVLMLPELDTLLSPLEGDEPTGVPPPDDDFSSPIVQLGQHCRKALRLEKSDLPEEREEAAKEWTGAAETGIEILARHWRNLDVAAQLIQALARTNGVAGVAWGYRLVAAFVRQYWDSLSAAWLGDFEGGLKSLSDLNAAVLAPLQRHPIAESRDGPVRFYQYSVAQKLEEASPEERDRQLARGALTMVDFVQRVAQTSDEYYLQLLSDLDAAGQAIQATEDILSEKLRELDQIHAMPATSAIRELLEDIERSVRTLVGDRLSVAATQGSSELAGGGETDPGRPATGPGAPVAGRVGSRAEALLQLEQLAALLEGLERQSLVPVVIRYGVWLANLGQREFFQYINQHGEQLYQILEPILGKTASEETSSE